MSNEERTALYRYLDSDGHPLYIGITQHLTHRKTAHANMAWAVAAASFTVEWFPTRAEAATAETEAIKAERPVYNDAENFDYVPFSCATWPCLTDEGRGKATKLADLMQAEIDSGRWRPGHKIPSPRELAATVGIAQKTADRALKLLSARRAAYRYKAFGYFVSDPATPRYWDLRPRMLQASNGAPAGAADLLEDHAA